MERASVPHLVLYALLIAIGLALVIAASTTGAAFGVYNLEWDGTSDFRELADQHSESHVVLETTRYDQTNANGTVAVVLAPTEPYGPNETQRLRRFVQAGGTLLVADDFGTSGNALLAELGVSARFIGLPLRDERHYYRAPSLPVATQVTETQYTQTVEQLTLNRATAIEAGNATVMAATSPFAYLDRNETGNLSATDELGSYPVVTTESLGDGQVIAVSDPSLFINAMLSEPDNTAFATAVVAAHDQALLDYSHAGTQPPLAAALLRFQSSPLLQAVVGALGVGVIWSHSWLGTVGLRLTRRLAGAIVPARWQYRLPGKLRQSPHERTGVDEDAIFATLQARYPEWDDDQLRRAMTDVLSTRPGDETDE